MKIYNRDNGSTVLEAFHRMRTLDEGCFKPGCEEHPHHGHMEEEPEVTIYANNVYVSDDDICDDEDVKGLPFECDDACDDYYDPADDDCDDCISFISNFMRSNPEEEDDFYHESIKRDNGQEILTEEGDEEDDDFDNAERPEVNKDNVKNLKPDSDMKKAMKQLEKEFGDFMDDLDDPFLDMFSADDGGEDDTDEDEE